MQAIAPSQTKTQGNQPALADMYQKDHAHYIDELERLSVMFAALRRINLISPHTVSEQQIINLQSDIDRLHRTLALHGQTIKGGVTCVQ